MTIQSITRPQKIALALGVMIVVSPVFAQSQSHSVPTPPSSNPTTPVPPAWIHELPATSPAPSTTAESFYSTQQLPVYQGQVRQFTLTPRGDIDGLILTDGTEVKTPPYLSAEFAYSVHPGDQVTIHGPQAKELSLIRAVSVTNQTNGQTITDTSHGKRNHEEIQGQVRMRLHGYRGEVNGVLLNDGTVIHLPPPEADRFAEIIKPGQILFAEGDGISNVFGHMIEANRIGSSKDQLAVVNMPPKRGRKHLRPHEMEFNPRLSPKP
ncbi:signal peptide [Candidatus Nitrosoglobus terrae]|uniref:Signal peptide n=1 Tax=Candidatus Nitrosoglobus terrae TaxID=1630141 RepID=A0A1Q2SPL2_9GAMM|nr:hypothetical protein [Candidatus Nitrosoglobus terrae]BAW81105.1 signal peptide [Candidatus Nitrosoglobus terrae]